MSDVSGMAQKGRFRGQRARMPYSWVPTQHYEEAVALSRQMKEAALVEARSAEERAEIMGHWPWDDMDEEKYM